MKNFPIKHKPMTDEDLIKILDKQGLEVKTDIKLEAIKKDYKIMNRINKAKKQEAMKELFGTFLHLGEVMILAGDTGVGKTNLAFQIADGISKGEQTLNQKNELTPSKILYYDFEMSDQSLLRRYKNYPFSNNFLCPNIDDLFQENDGIFSIDIIKKDTSSQGANIVIVDNISAIALKSTQDQDTALQLMKEFKKLNRENKTTFIIITHTPKIPSSIPLTINHIAGSKHLTNFCDNVCIIGKSSQGSENRYLKQLKSRNSEQNEQVLVMDLVDKGHLHFVNPRFDWEKNHLSINTDREEAKKEKYKNIANSYFNGSGIGYKEFCNNYAASEGLSFESGKNTHKILKNYDLIIQDNNKKWILNSDNI